MNRSRYLGPLLISGAALALLYAGSLSLAQVSGSSGLSAGEVAAMMPQPSNTVAPMESVNATAGVATTYRRSDAPPVRITRAATFVTTSGGVISGTWTTPMPAGTVPVIVFTPIATGASIDCQLTATPDASSFQGRCYTAQTTTLNLTIITAGLSLNPVANTAAGISVQVVALPPTQ